LTAFSTELLADRRVGDVGGDGEGGVSEFFGEVVQAIFAPGGEDGVAAFCGQEAGGGLADARGGAGDQGRISFEVRVHVYIIPPLGL
jgi:hypothetical protein